MCVVWKQPTWLMILKSDGEIDGCKFLWNWLNSKEQVSSANIKDALCQLLAIFTHKYIKHFLVWRNSSQWLCSYKVFKISELQTVSNQNVSPKTQHGALWLSYVQNDKFLFFSATRYSVAKKKTARIETAVLVLPTINLLIKTLLAISTDYCKLKQLINRNHKATHILHQLAAVQPECIYTLQSQGAWASTSLITCIARLLCFKCNIYEQLMWFIAWGTLWWTGRN